jgi:tetratricopeptide (TPR) repeat protein
MALLRALLLCFCIMLPLWAATIESIRSLLKSGHTPEALREIEDLQKQAGKDPDLQLEIGKILQELAASRAERLEQLAPESPQAHELTGKSFEAHDKTSEALTHYQLAAQKDPALPGIHFLIGNLYWKQRDLNAAMPELEAELRLNPNHSFANLRMGEILLTTNADHPEMAIPYLRKAASDSHMNLEAHRELGKALRMAGRYGEALKELQLVAERQPEDSKIHAQLAALYRATGNAEGVKKEMEAQREILQRQREASLQLHQAQPPR